MNQARQHIIHASAHIDYAVSLTAVMELAREPSGLPLLLLLRDVVTEQVVEPFPTKPFAHQGLLIRPDVPIERIEAIVKLIRQRYRYSQFPIYRKGIRGGWKTVRG